MSAEGESDDSTTIRRKILLSPTMPPRDSTDRDGSPLASLIGQVRLDQFALVPIPPFRTSFWAVSRTKCWLTTKDW